MMASRHGNISASLGYLCGEYTSHTDRSHRNMIPKSVMLAAASRTDIIVQYTMEPSAWRNCVSCSCGRFPLKVMQCCKQQVVDQIVELSVIWEAITIMWRNSNVMVCIECTYRNLGEDIDKQGEGCQVYTDSFASEPFVHILRKSTHLKMWDKMN